MPKISIVTIVKDHARGLTETYKSVTKQSFEDWEMLIVVGQSSDSTLSVAQSIGSMDTRVRVVAQTGLGIYAAMNEGVEHALGEFVWFMNAGDEFAENEVMNCGLQLILDFQVGLVIGGCQIRDLNSYRVYSFSSRKVSPLQFSFSRRGGCHQSMIFKTDIIRDLGGYVDEYKLANDFELILRVIDKAGAVRVPQVFATVEPGGVSELGILLVLKEKNQIRNAFFNSKWIDLMSLIWTFAAISKNITRRQLNKHLG